MTESKKSSLKSVALAVQQLQHKNEVPNKKWSEVNKCNQQWKDPKTAEDRVFLKTKQEFLKLRVKNFNFELLQNVNH